MNLTVEYVLHSYEELSKQDKATVHQIAYKKLIPDYVVQGMNLIDSCKYTDELPKKFNKLFADFAEEVRKTDQLVKKGTFFAGTLEEYSPELFPAAFTATFKVNVDHPEITDETE